MIDKPGVCGHVDAFNGLGLLPDRGAEQMLATFEIATAQ